MSSNPEMNVVVFLYKKWGFIKRHATSYGPTRTSDSVQTAWRRVQEENGITARQVREIYSEWSLTPEDTQFIATNFPNVQVSYSFERPADGDWDRVLKEAFMTMKSRQMTENMEQIRSSAPLLPILRNNDDFAEMAVKRPVIPAFCLCLAQAGPTPNGSIGISYMMRGALTGADGEEEQLWTQAYQNLAEGLVIKGGEDGGSKVLYIESARGFAASAIGLPNFADNAFSWLSAPRITIGIENPDSLVLWSAETPLTRKLYDQVLQSDYWGSVALTPSILALEQGILSVVAQRQQGSEAR
ncbi:MAG TPA: hypothetical protein VKU00_11195 [Chthonomonadaceae bacterium]|nr:hypothetical protein [Chthonomonadaceae bacterium]